MQNYNKMEVVGFEWPLNQNRFLIYEILYIYIYITRLRLLSSNEWLSLKLILIKVVGANRRAIHDNLNLWPGMFKP